MDGLDNSFGLTIATGSRGSDRAWLDMARVAQVADAHASDPAAVAAQLVQTSGTSASAFATMLDSLAGPGDALAARASDLITALGTTGTLPLMRRLDVNDRKRAAHAAANALTPPALVILAQAVGQSFSLPLSQPLLELIEKLSREAMTLPEGPRAQADQSFRSLMDHLVERWSESQVNAGSQSFADMFGTDTRAKSTQAPEPRRVVALSLESGAIGTVVWASLKEQSKTEAGVRDLIRMIARAPESHATQMISEQIVSPARLTALFTENPIDFDAVDMMIRHLGGSATRLLLDELVESSSRTTRRAIMDRLVKIGSDIAPLVQDRLSDPRWYVVRNMIALLRECGCEIDHDLLDRFTSHDDPRVRREMLQLRMENPALRSATIATALMDKDKSVLRVALQHARTDLPTGAVPGLAKRVTESDFPPEFRVMSLYLLGKSGHVAALDALIAFASGGKTLLGKVKLANKTPEMLAALSGLARSWAADRRAKELLDLAAKSKDDQILNALNAVSGGD
jgi:hypothetical protein